MSTASTARPLAWPPGAVIGGVTPLLLLGVGSLMYILGAAVYATRRPDPWPSTFGFHEVFHSMVVAAVAIHFVAMVFWIVPATNPA